MVRERRSRGATFSACGILFTRCSSASRNCASRSSGSSLSMSSPAPILEGRRFDQPAKEARRRTEETYRGASTPAPLQIVDDPLDAGKGAGPGSLIGIRPTSPPRSFALPSARLRVQGVAAISEREDGSTFGIEKATSTNRGRNARLCILHSARAVIPISARPLDPLAWRAMPESGWR
jgi:hypothetical protein